MTCGPCVIIAEGHFSIECNSRVCSVGSVFIFWHLHLENNFKKWTVLSEIHNEHYAADHPCFVFGDTLKGAFADHHASVLCSICRGFHFCSVFHLPPICSSKCLLLLRGRIHFDWSGKKLFSCNFRIGLLLWKNGNAGQSCSFDYNLRYFRELSFKAERFRPQRWRGVKEKRGV